MFQSKYGVARHIYIPVPKAGSANHAVGADWTPAAGDVKISKDGGAAANVTNLPTAIAMGNSTLWDFSLTATEMEAAQIAVTVADSATKAVDDTGFEIETYGHASAQHAMDFDDAVRGGLTALPNAAAAAAGGLHTLGANAGNVSYTGTWTQTGHMLYQDGVKVTCSSSGRSAFDLTGNGAGHGIVAASTDGCGFAATSTNSSAIAADPVDLGILNVGLLAISTNLTVGGNTTLTGNVTATAGGNDIRGVTVGSVGTGAIVAASFAANAIDATALATTAVNEIRNSIVNLALAELAGDPGATPLLQDAIMLVYMALRNKRDTTATTDEIHNDAGSVILTASVADAAGTFTKSKYA